MGALEKSPPDVPIVSISQQLEQGRRQLLTVWQCIEQAVLYMVYFCLFSFFGGIRGLSAQS